MTSDRHAPLGDDAVLSDPQSGRLLDGRYIIGTRIARGGMASVYQAVDNRLNRLVAVKIMHPNFGEDTEFAVRFVQEAHTVARLTHPNVVAVYDQGEENGTVYLAMEYISGQTLRDVIRKESPMPPARALVLIQPVLAALAAAHEVGLIHRDVKPENVLIAHDGRIKVADFGLAKAVGADSQHSTTDGTLIGTVSYLAPELVVDGRGDARADVYAAGVVLFEMLTGVKPHDGESAIQVAYQHVHEDIPPPSDLVSGIPPSLDNLVARATSRDQKLRPADAGVMLHEVQRCAAALAGGMAPGLAASDLGPALLATGARRGRAASSAASSADSAATAETSVVPRIRLPLRRAPEPEPIDEAGYAVESDDQGFAGFPDDEDGADVPARRATSRAIARAPRAPRAPRGTGRPRARQLRWLALLLVVVATAGTWWGLTSFTSTPGVIGLTADQAKAQMAAAGLEVRFGAKEYSETVPVDRVVRTDPTAGSRVLDGGTVTVVLSLGKERYDVPKLRGMTEDQAQEALAQTKLIYGTSIDKYSDRIPAGNVISTNPKVGTTVRPGTVVDLVISQGPKPIEVPDWTGRNADKATAKLQGLGFEVDRTDERYSDTVAEGVVISQSPDTGTLFRGDTVRLVVSLGPELVQVPTVKGSGVATARALLESLGFVVRVERATIYLGLGYVASTDPPAGSLVAKGTTITIFKV